MTAEACPKGYRVFFRARHGTERETNISEKNEMSKHNMEKPNIPATFDEDPAADIERAEPVKVGEKDHRDGKQVITFRASEPLILALDKCAADEHRNRGSLIRHALWTYLHAKSDGDSEDERDSEPPKAEEPTTYDEPRAVVMTIYRNDSKGKRVPPPMVLLLHSIELNGRLSEKLSEQAIAFGGELTETAPMCEVLRGMNWVYRRAMNVEVDALAATFGPTFALGYKRGTRLASVMKESNSESLSDYLANLGLKRPI
jgi:hypothetical protein